MRAVAAFVTFAMAAAATAGHAQPGTLVLDVLTDQAPRAEYPLDLDLGDIVTLSTSSGTGLDTVLTLVGPDGREVAMNDDRGDGTLNSRIIYAARASGRYRAVVTGYANAVGSFELQIYHGADVGLSYQARPLGDQVVSLTPRENDRRFEVDLAAGEPFVATTLALSEELDTTLTLLDAQGVTVASNDDRGDGTLNSQIIFAPARAGRYTLVAGTFAGASAGDAVLSMAVDPNAQAPFDFSGIERSVIARHEGDITNEQPEYNYPLELQPGQTILMTADSVNGDLDPVLTLFGADGYPVALNDDRGDGSLNSAAAFTSPAGGSYTLNVARFASGETVGAFVVEISDVAASVVGELQAQYENPVRLSGPEQVIETADFRLIYTLSGRDRTTEDYARATAEALQRAYDTQIGQMGWAAPIRDPNGRYRAYVADAGDGTMGYMKGVEVVFDNPQTSDVRERAASRGILVVDNNLGEGRDEGEDPNRLMRATVAHEFNHLVQYGYDAEEELQWLYESSASWIETATMGQDEDAARYAVTDFAAPQLCWTTTEPGHNYGQWTLLQSLSDSHGPRIVIRLWENASTLDGLETMSQTLAEVGADIPGSLRRWRIQNFARDYEMAPRIDGAVDLSGSIKRGGGRSASGSVQELGASYLQVRANGPHAYVVNGAETLELVGLGVRDGQIDVVPLGRGGVFDADGYDSATLMVFNAQTPERPGDCHDSEFQIQAEQTEAAAAPVAYRINARHFRAPEL